MNLVASNGCYVTAESNGGIDSLSGAIALRANRTEAGIWEDFTEVKNEDGTVSFLTGAGYYITAEGGGGSSLSTNRTAIGPWEKFRIVPKGNGEAYLCSDNIHYLCAEIGSCDPIITATRTIVGPWEIFTGGSSINPSRAAIINYNGNLCNLRDADDWPIFDAFIDWLIFNNINKANDWVVRLKDAGSTHINLDLSGDYSENLGWAPRYPIPGTDWTKDIDSFKKVLDWVINKGFIPHIHLAADGQGNGPGYNDPNGMTYGFDWGMNNLPSILQSLSQYWKKCLWNGGYDGCFPNWSVPQFESFLLMLRSVLGDSSQIAAEFGGPGSVGYCHLGNGAADWDGPLQELDVFLIELQAWPCPDDGIAQTATRLLGPDAKNCPTTPYYLASTRKRGECGITFYETLAYWAIRKYATPADAIISAKQGQKFGFKNFGNGLPQ